MKNNKDSLPRPLPPQPSTAPAHIDFSQPIINSRQKDQFANFSKKHEAPVRNHSYQEHFGSLTESQTANTEVLL